MTPFTPKMRHFNDYPKKGKYKLQLFMLILFSISGVMNNFRMVYKYYKLLLFCLPFVLSQQTEIHKDIITDQLLCSHTNEPNIT